jgi:hypothetical protein
MSNNVKLNQTLTRVGCAIGLVAVTAVAFSHFGVKAQGFPSSKAAIAIDPLIALSKATNGASPTGTAGDTGWKTVLETQIKMSSQKDLAFDVAMQCGIVTDTTVNSKNGGQASSSARANIAVRVLVDGEPAEPHNSLDATKTNADGVVYCDRVQTLNAKFSGLNCTADLTSGAVTCADPETLQLILQTLNANAFNFAKSDVGVGVHTITVEARAQASVNFDNDQSGLSLAGAEAFAGAGSMVVEGIRLVKGTDIIVDIE